MPSELGIGDYILYRRYGHPGGHRGSFLGGTGSITATNNKELCYTLKEKNSQNEKQTQENEIYSKILLLLLHTEAKIVLL